MGQDHPPWKKQTHQSIYKDTRSNKSFYRSTIQYNVDTMPANEISVSLLHSVLKAPLQAEPLPGNGRRESIVALCTQKTNNKFFLWLFSSLTFFELRICFCERQLTFRKSGMLLLYSVIAVCITRYYPFMTSSAFSASFVDRFRLVYILPST